MSDTGSEIMREKGGGRRPMVSAGDLADNSGCFFWESQIK